MKRYITFLLLIGVANVGCTSPGINLANLNQCIEVVSTREDSFHNARFLIAEIKIRQIIANCGCKSAEIAYHVMEQINKDTKYERVYGIINTLGPEKQKKAFMLSGDALKDTSKLTIELGCKNPD